MPTYRPPSYGIQLSQALAEAAAVAPIARTMLTCLEFSHPSVAEPIRLVADTDDVTVTHEAGAPLAPSASATYLAAPISVGIAEESPAAGTPEIIVTISHVNGAVKQALDATRTSREPWTVIERMYASDDLTGPAKLPPLQLQVTAVEFPGDQTARMRCAYGDPAQRAVPRVTFRSSQYPGLSAR